MIVQKQCPFCNLVVSARVDERVPIEALRQLTYWMMRALKDHIDSNHYFI